MVADPSRNSFVSRYNQISSAFKARRVSPSAVQELLTYYEYVWERDRDHKDFYETAAKLPEGLQRQIALALHSDVLSKVNAFRGASPEVFERIAIALRPRIFTPGDFIVKSGKISNKMYIISEGRVGLVSSNGMSISKDNLLTGSVLGEASMINEIEEQHSAIALTYVEAFELVKEDFDEIVQIHPQIQTKLTQKTYK